MNLKTVDHLLTTTRSVRRRLDLTRPVEPEIIQKCIDIAIQAPTGGGISGYHFMVVTDPEKRAKLARIYQESFAKYLGDRSPEGFGAGIYDSARYLANHMHEVPVHILVCIDWVPRSATPFDYANIYGSILPAAWSLMLALRSRGLGSAWTTLHCNYQADIAALLGMPETLTHAVLLPVAYFKGEDFKPARRVPGRERTYWDTWGNIR